MPRISEATTSSLLVRAALALSLVHCSLDTTGALDESLPGAEAGSVGGASAVGAAGVSGGNDSAGNSASGGAAVGAGGAGKGGAKATAGHGGAAGKGGASHGGAGSAGEGGGAAGGAPGDGGQAGAVGDAGAGGGGAGEGGAGGKAQAGSSQGGTAQAGASQGGSSQAGSSQAGSSQAGSSQGGSSQAGSSQGGSSQAGSSQGGASQGGSAQAGSSQGGGAQAGGGQGGGAVCGDGVIDVGEQCDPGAAASQQCASCAAVCPAGMTLATDGSGHCYELFTTPATFDAANNACAGLSATVGASCHLLTLTNDNERLMVLDLFKATLSSSFWIGAIFNGLVRGSSDAFVWLTWEYFAFGPTYDEWSSATKPGGMWAGNQPDGKATGERCLELTAADGYKLNDFDCAQARPYACECEPPGRRCNFDGKLDAGEECDDGNHVAGDGCDACVVECTVPAGYQVDGLVKAPDTHHCYALIGNGKNFDDARGACASMGPGWALTSVNNFREHSFLVLSLDLSNATWVDATDRDDEGNFKLPSGAPFPFAGDNYPWKKGEPNDWLWKEDCVVYFEGDERFNDDDCDNDHRFLCERKPAGEP